MLKSKGAAVLVTGLLVVSLLFIEVASGIDATEPTIAFLNAVLTFAIYAFLKPKKSAVQKFKAKSDKQKGLIKRHADRRPAKKWYADHNLVYMILGLLALTLIAYSPTFSNEFTNWDDDLYVHNNPMVKQLDGETIAQIFDLESFVAGNYHPLTILTLNFNYQMTGMDEISYQVTNVLLHLLNTFLVFLFIFKLTKRKKEVALICAAIFALHPMHVESVSWMAERKDVLYTAFFMGGLITYLRYRKSGKWTDLGWTLVLFVLSGLSKPAAVVFPVVLLLIDYYKKADWNTRLIIEKVPFFIVAVLFGLITLTAQTEASAYGGLQKWSIMERLLISAYGFVMYIVRFFIPYEMSAFYPYPKGGTIPGEFYAHLVVALGIAGLAIWSMRKTRVVAFGMGFFLVTVALVLQFVSVGNAILADRYTYVPYIGLGFIIGMGYYNLVNGKYPALKSLRSVAMPALLVAGLIFAVVTFQRTKVWRNTVTLFTNVINNYPTAAVAYQNRGHYYRQMSDEAGVNPQQREELLNKALSDYNSGLTYSPKNAALYSNRGKIWFERQDFQRALEDYNKSLELGPNRVETLVNRAGVYGFLKRYPDALQDLNRALELDPNYTNAYFNRGIIYSQMQQSNNAIADYSAYLSARPGAHGIYNSRGVEYQRIGQYQQSIQDFTQAINLTTNPGEQAIYYGNRAISYQAIGNNQLAAQDRQQAQRLGGR